MHKGMIKMPWFLYQISFAKPSRRDTIENVFRMVLQDTNEPVTIVLDIASEKDLALSTDASLEGVTNSVRTGATMGLTSLKSKQLVKEIKHYVADARVARCLFAASEGLMFQELGRSEPRLTVFVAGEVSVEIAKNYLKHLLAAGHHKNTDEYDDRQLKLFPRTFSNLLDFATALNKGSFVQKALRAEVEKVSESFRSVRAPWLPFFSHPVKTLYQTALTRDIGVADYGDMCGLSKEQFVAHFVKTNIFQQTEEGTYKLQFDATRHAVASLVGKKGWLW